MESIVESSQKFVEYKVGNIVRYTGYEGDLINYPDKKPVPDKYFKVLKADLGWGVVDHGTDTIGVAYIRKANLFEKIKYWLFWEK